MQESVTATRLEAVPLSSRPSLHRTNTAWLNGTETAETMTNRTCRIPVRPRAVATRDAHITTERTRCAGGAPGQPTSSALARATAPSHRALGLGLRANVSRSTDTSPKVGP